MCIYELRSNQRYGTSITQPSTILMSNDGWCGHSFSFVGRHVGPFVPGAAILVPPTHGILSAAEGPNLTMGIYFKPEPGFVGEDNTTLSLRYGRSLDATYIITVVVTGPDGIFSHDPPRHSLPHGVSVLVRDGTCPSGQIKQVTSGTPRKIACIPFSG